MSVRDQTLVQSAVIISGGASISSFALSKSLVHRQRQDERAKIARSGYRMKNPAYIKIIS